MQRLYKALFNLIKHENVTVAVLAISAISSLCLTEELGETVMTVVFSL